jgi:hypothetical protein
LTHQPKPQKKKQHLKQKVNRSTKHQQQRALKIIPYRPQEGHTLVLLKIFATSKFLQYRIRQVKDLKRLNSGSIPVEAASNHHVELLALLHGFADTPVSCCPHRLLNSIRVVIRCCELRDCEKDEIIHDLKHQGVVAAKQLISNCNGSMQRSNTVFLTFNSPTPPTSVTVAFYLKVSVQPFILNYLRCFKRQKYCHGSKFCRKLSADEDLKTTPIQRLPTASTTVTALTTVAAIRHHPRSAQRGYCNRRSLG